jgi:hypothetical protein
LTDKSNQEGDVSKELAHEFRLVEYAQISSNVILAIVGIIALCIYNGQLKQMRRSTKAAEKAAISADNTLKEIQKGGTDTHELAVQAKNQADRTRDIADRALAQANATNFLARETKRATDIAERAMQTNIELSREDRRAWVGLQGFQCTGCTVDTDFSIIVRDFTGILVNTGKTPALKMTFNNAFMNRKRGEPIPDWETVQRETAQPPRTLPPNIRPDLKAGIQKSEEIIKRESIEVEALPPNAVRTFAFPSGKFGRERFSKMEDQTVIYIVGLVTYYDTRLDREHHTRFCLVDIYGDGFRFCSSGNDMD